MGSSTDTIHTNVCLMVRAKAQPLLTAGLLIDEAIVYAREVEVVVHVCSHDVDRLS